MNQLQVVNILTEPPHVAPEDGYEVVRVAKVRLRWNSHTKEWDWDAPEGISNYTKQTKAVA